ncbi:hypothetical protein XH88_06575 [Bradyrhizobium sp. CCBAU 51627]|nr:hypothetical protein [Bradyrhizobium sp. CCBAU 51627]
MVQYPTSRSMSFCPKISRFGPRPAARDALHALLPLGAAGLKNGQVLFDEFKPGSAARLPGYYLQYGQLKAHLRAQKFNENTTIPALPKTG